MATFDEYAEALYNAVVASCGDPANLTGTFSITATTDDDNRYLETAITELAEPFWRVTFDSLTEASLTVAPTGYLWSLIQAPVEE